MKGDTLQKIKFTIHMHKSANLSSKLSTHLKLSPLSCNS